MGTEKEGGGRREGIRSHGGAAHEQQRFSLHTHLLRQCSDTEERKNLGLAHPRRKVEGSENVVLLRDGTDLLRRGGLDRNRRVEERVEQRIRGDDAKATCVCMRRGL